MPPSLLLINPPALKGRTNERTYSGGIGVSRKLKPFEREATNIPPIDVLYTAAVAERAGIAVTLVDLLLERFHGRTAERFCLNAIDSRRLTGAVWIGVRVSMPSLAQDLAFANRMKALLPSARVFVFGAAIMATIDHWIRRTSVDYVFFGEPEAIIDQALTAGDPLSLPGVVSPATYEPLEGEDLYDERQNAARDTRWVKVTDIGRLPRPAWHLLEMPRYSPTGNPSDVGVYVQAAADVRLAVRCARTRRSKDSRGGRTTSTPSSTRSST
jgi:hypothetical protein